MSAIMMRPIVFSIRVSILAVLSCASLAPAGEPAPKPPTLRLPEGTRPTHATVELTVDPRQSSFSGVENLELSLSEAHSVLWLNANELKVARAEARVGERTVAARVIETPKDFVGFAFAEPLPAGAATLHVEWTGILSTRNSNGASKQQDSGDWYVFSKFEPIAARRVFPSFDEPSYKIPWKVSLRVPSRDRAFANDAEERVEEAGA
jgi:alanyl aminopeptidase